MHKKMNIKGCRPFAPSRYITVVIPALLCLFLQNKYVYYGNTVSESQYGSKGCSRMLSESFYRKSRKGNGSYNVADHNRSNDYANTLKDNHGEFNVRDLNDKLEDARGSKGNMVKHHKENKRTSVGMNRKRNKNREQYCEEEEMYDEYSGQNWQYTDANHDDRYRNESYYGEMYDENNRKGQTYADEKHNNHNYTNEEYYNGEPDMYNSNEEEIIPHNDNSNLDSFNDVMRGYSKGGRAQKRGNKNNVIPEVNSMGNTQTSNREISYETHQESSLNRNCPIFQDDVDTILEKLGDMVHYTDMINIFVIVNLMERNEFFDALQSLMTYWNDYDNGSKISDEYKHKQWLKVYGDMTNELMQKERKFYNKLYHILDNTHIQKRVYINFINEVRYTWIKMRQEIKGQWKGYLENKAKRYKRKT